VKRRVTFLVAAVQALMLVAVGLGITLAPLTLSWLLENDSSTPWSTSYQASVDVWLAAHGVPILFAASKFAGLAVPAFTLSFLPLGFAFFVGYAAFRLGRQLVYAEVLWPGWLGATSAYAAATWIFASTAPNDAVSPEPWLALVLPPAFFFVFVVIGSLTAPLPSSSSFEISSERARMLAWAEQLRDRLGFGFRAILIPALRAGTAVVLMMLMVSALALSILFAVNWVQITQLYESLQVTFLGALLVTVGQLAALPNLVIFGASWFTGVGFSIGEGSHVSPLGTELGPIPVVPMLGALPVGQMSFGLVAVLVPMLASFIATILVRKHLDEARFQFAFAWSAALSVGLSIAAVAAIEMALLGAAASGAAGPGRLHEVGINPWMLGLLTFVEVGVVSVLTAFYSAKPVEPDQELISRVRRPQY